MAKGKSWEDRLKDYVDVKTRVGEFYQKYPTGRIIPSIVESDRTAGFMYVMMKAEVFRYHDEPEPAAVGHAFELSYGAGPINETSHIENCETSAVGRALAFLNMGISHAIASREEMEKVQRMTTEGDPEIVEKIRAIWKENGGTEEQLDTWVKKNNNDVGLDDLKGDRQQAMLTVLEAKKAEREEKAKANLTTVSGEAPATEEPKAEPTPEVQPSPQLPPQPEAPGETK